MRISDCSSDVCSSDLNTVFLEDLLFTHRGLSGPAVLQISSYWNPGDAIVIDLAPGQNLEKGLLDAKAGSRQQLGSVLAGLWPKRLADRKSTRLNSSH